MSDAINVLNASLNKSISFLLSFNSSLTPRVCTLKLTVRHTMLGARCSSMVRVFAHGAMGRRIDLSWGGPIEIFPVPVSAPQLV